MKSPLKTIELKTEGKITYFISELSLEQKDLIIQSKQEGTLDITSAKFLINCKGIVLIGSASRITTANVGKYIGFFLGADQGKVFNSNNPFSNRQIYYRDYAFSKEKQEKNMWLINLCPDMRMSINSLKRVINSEYCCIWKKEN